MSKNKNKPDEVYFKAKEYNAKFRQIKWFSKDITDKLILALNGLSNNHGRYWL
ncbi:MAG: hypothetical protein MK105_18010 [Crocinitomicaceae bacterium]|nr:hypothetical protein [Crocinitomicaceae bacterium]